MQDGALVVFGPREAVFAHMIEQQQKQQQQNQPQAAAGAPVSGVNNVTSHKEAPHA